MNTKANTKSDSIFLKLDNSFENKQKVIFYLSLFLLVLFGVLLFDLRISVGGDDSGYLQSAKKFATGEVFPSWHGTFYIMFMGWVYKIFGFHLTLFKIFSLLFLIGHQILTYYTFKGRISPFILSIVLLVLSVNSSILYFASQTYSESFYMLIQGAFLFIFIKYLPRYSNNLIDIRHSWFLYILLGLSAFLLSIVKNIGIIAVVVIVVYFLLNRKVYSVIFTLLSFGFFKLLFGVYKKLVWGIEFSSKSGQFSEVLLKDPYNMTKGQEDFMGMLVRVVENLKIYLSRVLMQQFGLKDLSNTNTSWFVSILVVALLILGLVFAFKKKNETIKIIFLYVGGSLLATFVALQQMWAQARMILPYIHLIILCILFALGMLATIKKFSLVRIVAIVMGSLIVLFTFFGTVKKAKAHQETLTKNLAGNRYYGYTPDWINFLKMSEWVSKNVDEKEMVVSRKPSMSFIYGNGREFYPMYRIPVEYADDVMAQVDSSDKNVLFIKETDLRSKPANLIYLLKPEMTAAISADNVLYGVYLIDSAKFSDVNTLLESNSITSIQSSDEFRTAVLNKAKETTAIIPDKLIQKLIDNNVKYAIIGSLRVNPSQKTDRTINTVARYMASIQLKYPSILTQVHQIGRNDLEPARLYKIEYARYGLK